MTRIAFFEPDWAARNARDWTIRGSYKYPSLLGELCKRADITLLMRTPPPVDDAHRLTLERDHGVRFAAIESCEDPEWPAADMLAAEYAGAIAKHAPDIVSTLNGRMIGINFAIARAAREVGIDYVYRIAGNDIVTRASVFAEQGRPFAGSAVQATMIAEESFAAESARTVIVMGGTECERAAGIVSDPDKIRICQRGVDLAHFAPAEVASQGCTRILFVGRNSPEKGIDLIEAAAERLETSCPEMRFTIAGDFAEREQRNRRYLGFHDYTALPDLYRGHDLLLLPARSEGFAQVVMEAMGCGLSALLSRHLFAHDFEEEGQGVRLIGLDAAEIAAALDELHREAKGFASLRAEALAHARAHFDADINRPLYHEAMLGVAA